MTRKSPLITAFAVLVPAVPTAPAQWFGESHPLKFARNASWLSYDFSLTDPAIFLTVAPFQPA